MARETPTSPWKAAAETALGLVLAAVPVALWVAWTPQLFALVLGTSIVCAALLVAVNDGVGARDAHGPLASIPRERIEELHRLFPLTYHHGRRRDPRFHALMEKLRRLTRS